MMIDFFGTLPGLLSLAGAAVLLILISVVRRLRARAAGRQGRPEAAPRRGGGRAGAARGSAAAGEAGPPRWLVAAVAAYAASGESAAPSAEAWKPAVSWHDPWLAAGGPGRRNLGVYK